MKFLDRLALKIFSLIIIILAVGVILLITGILTPDIILGWISVLSDGNLGIKITIGILAILILLALKGLFFTSKNKDRSKDGIILENANGKLVISKESLENLIASVIKETPGAESVSSKTILDKDKNLIIYVTATVSKDVMIKDISNELQQKIMQAMKKTADLDVKEVNIKIKNITNKKVKGLPSPNEEELQETVEEVQEVLEEKVETVEENNSSEEE